MHGRVVGVQRLTPGMVRVTLGEGDLAGFRMPGATDAYINAAIPPVDAPYDAVFDPARVRAELPQQTWPARRRYTVRAWDAVKRHLTVDFVVHGDGVAGPWAADRAPGDVLVFEGPSGGYRPDPTADWHLLAGDESALPAIAGLPRGCPGRRPGDREAGLRRATTRAGTVLAGAPGRAVAPPHGRARGRRPVARALRDLPFPRGRVHAFVHGEADEIREIRRHLLLERGLARADMSCSPYWRRQMTDEAWRTVKRDFVAAMEAEVA